MVTKLGVDLVVRRTRTGVSLRRFVESSGATYTFGCFWTYGRSHSLCLPPVSSQTHEIRYNIFVYVYTSPLVSLLCRVYKSSLVGVYNRRPVIQTITVKRKLGETEGLKTRIVTSENFKNFL